MTLLVLVVLLTSELPDPGRVSTITFSATFGSVIGALAADLRKLPSERAGDATRAGLILGFGAGVLGLLVVFAIDRL
ncbi:MAG: hypothetical protein JSS99_04635 [Actinobacteria bacterium]|nr:hypothetical protein [Actinomycetota bacterium]